MQLSAFTIVDGDPDEGSGERDRLRDAVELGVAADAAGLTAIWVAEHHFDSVGQCPAPSVLLAAIGARTRTIRLGVMVSVLPFHDPVDLAEQYALLDRLSAGRLNLGVGSGYLASEFEGFGIDPATKRDRFDAAYDRLIAAMGGETVTLSAMSTPVRINVRPVQTPHPPIWIAVQRREAVPFVGRRGANLALIPYATLASVEELREIISEYRASLPSGTTGRVSIGLHLYAGDRPEVARASLQRFLDSRLRTHSTHYEAKVKADPGQATSEAIERSGFALLGAPADVAERLSEFRRAGVDEVMGIFDFGGLPIELATASVRAMGREWNAR